MGRVARRRRRLGQLPPLDAGQALIAKAQGFVDVINEAGGSAQLLDATGYSHEEVSSQLGAPADTLVTPPVTDFVRACLAR